MADLTMARLHEAMTVLYAISLVFYFIDYLNKDAKAHRIAFWLVSIVWVMQSVFLGLYITETHRFPILSLFEGIYFYAWLLVTISILLHCLYRVDLPVFFLNVIGFIFISIHTFAPNQIAQSPVGDSLISELLIIHITFAILSYVAFSLSFVFSTLYLILYNVLKKKKWTKQWTRLPSLDQAQKGMSSALLTGIPFLLISLILGLQWGFASFDHFSIFDAKIIGSFISLLIYCLILFGYRKGKLHTTMYAWTHVYAFLIIIINFFLGSRLSSFHFWN
ncbi:cytochrome c biogenesis protein CcsA [Rummeliibacillus suwonensis]|uniref:cytochrome c biogenesis protein CcsA n=1 Tax=Rummeliibacillus suwonensis TaxID=1306154 RepID=UPI0011B728C6|nr:cytochrome c biogenesis protein CcsA [Rummeliibacillus suwonensis]MBO2537481.1 cytochrome c biogenesis protein CcsA [Rummeliibacillus suwonensis]